MTLINFQAELALTNSLLTRIAVALERLAGPIIPPPSPPYQSTLSDLSYSSAEEQEEIRLLEMEMSTHLHAIPGTEAFDARLQEFEQAILDQGGSLDDLPWRARNAEGKSVKSVSGNR